MKSTGILSHSSVILCTIGIPQNSISNFVSGTYVASDPMNSIFLIGATDRMVVRVLRWIIVILCEQVASVLLIRHITE